MIHSPYHLYAELLTQKFSNNFKSLSIIDKDLKFEMLSPDNPRNVALSITTKAGKFMFKQPKIDTIGSIDPYENEINYYQNFHRFGYNFFCNRYKKYIILPWIEKDRMQALKFFVSKKLDDVYSKKFVEKSIVAINQFHQISNEENKKGRFLKNSYSSIEPMYVNILRLFRKAHLTKRFEAIFFPNDCEKSRKNVRLLTVDFFKEEKVANFFLQLTEKQHFTNDYLIHGDMNVNNLRGEIDKTFQVIDFEFVCLGDPLWDYVCYVESVFSKYFTNINQQIYQIRFEILMSFLKGFLNINDLKNNKKDLERYFSFLIIYKLKYLINDNSEFAYSEEGTKVVMTSIRNLIDDKNTFVELIMKGEFNDECVKYLFAPGCYNKL